MKKVININFQGRVIPIEESAYETLKRYTESLSLYFANEEGRDEIINDIEGRIAELFGDILKKGSTCITDVDVLDIIASIGRPEDFDGDEARVHSTLSSTQATQQEQDSKKLYRSENNKIIGGVCAGVANYLNVDPLIIRLLTAIFIGFTFLPYIILWAVIPSSASASIGSQRRRLFRDPDHKVIAGVCSGLAQYFSLSIWIPRIIFLAPFIFILNRHHGWDIWGFPNIFSFSFWPTMLFVYIILWIIIPEAKSAADKLEMKGEKVDLNNIKTTIQGDLVGVKERTMKAGAELKERAQELGATMQEQGKHIRSEIDPVIKKSRRGIGDIIVFVIKAIAYLFVGCLLLGLVIGLFVTGIASASLLFIFKEYVLRDGLQNMLAWGTLLLGIWVPIIGVVIFIIRRLTKKRGNSTTIRSSFIAMWVVGIFCAIGLVTTVANDFKYHNYPATEKLALNNPTVNKLEVKTSWFNNYYNRNSWFRIEAFSSFDEDTAYVRNIRVRIVQAPNDSFAVSVIKIANGSSRQQAMQTAQKIQVQATQHDTSLFFTKGIAITPQDKFRNQHAIVTIAVPVGKRILIADKNGWGEGFSVHLGDNDNFWDWDEDEEERSFWWRPNVEYVMTKSGLERVDKKSADDNDENMNEDSNNTIEEFRRSKEQMEREKEQKIRELQKIEEELKQNIDTNSYRYSPAPKPAANTKAPKELVEQVSKAVPNDIMMMKFAL